MADENAALLAKMKSKQSRAHFPTGCKSLRACLKCRLIMDKKQWFDLGCVQCPELRMQENENRVIACTTTDFDCYVSNIRPGGFVTRFIGLEKSIPGLYANKVRGEIPPEVQFEDELDDIDTRSAIDDVAIPGLSDLDDSDDDNLKADKFKTPTPSSQPTTSRTNVSDKTVKTPQPAEKPSVDSGSKSKKRKVQDTRVGKPQPPSVSSVSASEEETHADAIGKALAFLGDSDAESDSQARSNKQSEKSGQSGQVVVSAHSGSEAGSTKDLKNPSVGGPSSHGTSKASEGSVAILQPDEDTEFKGAPQ
jgi:transcription elongation factor SPT4